MLEWSHARSLHARPRWRHAFGTFSLFSPKRGNSFSKWQLCYDFSPNQELLQRKSSNCADGLNPTSGSWWMVQTRPTKSRIQRIPPVEAGGSFTPNLQPPPHVPNPTSGSWWMVHSLPTKAGLERTTSFRRWDYNRILITHPVEMKADYLVSRDNDLLDLMK